eukprot:1160964-Pelagomonas_calceolata.AAC.5
MLARVHAGVPITWQSDPATATLAHALHAARAKGEFGHLVPPLPPYVAPPLLQPDGSTAAAAAAPAPVENAVVHDGRQGSVQAAQGSSAAPVGNAAVHGGRQGSAQGGSAAAECGAWLAGALQSVLAEATRIGGGPVTGTNSCSSNSTCFKAAHILPGHKTLDDLIAEDMAAAACPGGCPMLPMVPVKQPQSLSHQGGASHTQAASSAPLKKAGGQPTQAPDPKQQQQGGGVGHAAGNFVPPCSLFQVSLTPIPARNGKTMQAEEKKSLCQPKGCVY